MFFRTNILQVVLYLLSLRLEGEEILTLLKMGPFQGSSRLEEQKGLTPLNISHISRNDETLHSYTSPKEDPKNKNNVKHPLSFADISIFSAEISNFCYVKKDICRLHFKT